MVSEDIPLAIQIADRDRNLPGNDIACGLAHDCKSLFDFCNRPTSKATEEKIMLDLLDMRGYLDRDENVLACWIQTIAMLVDTSTKHLADITVLDEIFESNKLSLR